MKSGKKNNKLMKLFGATSVTLFSLTTVFVATIAWFAMNNNVGGNGTTVTCSPGSDIKILSCYAVRYDGNYGATAVDISSGSESITMSEYDYIFTDRNVNTPLFLRFELSNFVATQDLTVSIPCSGSYKTDNKVDPYLSNVVGAQFLYGIKQNGTLIPDINTWTGKNVSNEYVVASYQGMLDHESDNIGTPFVQNGSKQSSLVLTLDADDVFNGDFIITRKDENNNDIDVVVVYIALDYYVTDSTNLVSAYLDSYNGAEHSLSFISDISMITVANEENR